MFVKAEHHMSNSVLFLGHGDDVRNLCKGNRKDKIALYFEALIINDAC